MAWVLLMLALPRSTWAADPPTYTKDVAPILFARCVSCHRPGAIAPFSLTTYRETRQRMTLIAEVTRRRAMPPWKPRRDAGEFLDDRSLSEVEIQRIGEWAAGGGREGDGRDLPTLPTFAEGWQFGPPDLVVTMPTPYTVASSGGDVFRTFVLPIPTERARYVRAIEFQPGNARVVHHANMGVDRTRSSRRLDESDAEPGYVGGMVQDAGYPPGYMLGWTPGQGARPSPEGMAWRLEANSDFVVQLHMQPTGKPESVQARLGLYFTDEAPRATPVGLRLGSQTIDIPAGVAGYVTTDRFILPVDADLLAVQPHAHNLGRQIHAEAMLPDGTVRGLLTIDDWDFRWQDVYRYRAAVRLPKGTLVTMQWTFDNSAANARNAFQPPRRVVWGQNTSDEMGDLWLQLVPVSPGDLGVLAREVQRKSAADDFAAYTKVLKADPANPLRHHAVGMLDLQAGRMADAAQHFRDSLALNPDSAPTHYNLGLTMALMRRYDDARVEFEATTRLDPSHAQAHNNLGVMLQQLGRLSDALVQYRRATVLSPDNAEALNNLGRILTADRQYTEAIEVLRRAVAVSPNYVPALSALSWIRSSAADADRRDPAEALALANRAVALSGRQDAVALDAAGAAHAASGAFEQAVAAVTDAMRLADQAGMAALWIDMRERLQLYQRQQSYRLP